MNTITVTAIIEANKKKVWEYYTNPAHIVHWNFADTSWCCPKSENDLRVGGRYFARMEAKDGSSGFDFEAVFTEVIDGEKLVYTFGGRQATVLFVEIEQQTQVTVIFDPENEHSIEMQQFGWQSILNNFKEYVEKNN